MRKKCLIATGGGDCPGLNAVIRAITRAAIIRHNAQVIGIENGFEGFAEFTQSVSETCTSNLEG